MQLLKRRSGAIYLTEMGAFIARRISMNVKADGKTWLLHFDDWMYLQDSTRLFNKTEMKKFGVTVATVTLFFTRKEGG